MYYSGLRNGVGCVIWRYICICENLTVQSPQGRDLAPLFSLELWKQIWRAGWTALLIAGTVPYHTGGVEKHPNSPLNGGIL
jgi:hypothetical protein